MMNFVIRLREMVEGAYYEMTHVSTVMSRGFWMANAVGLMLWVLIVVAVIKFINSDLSDSLVSKISNRMDDKHE